MRKREAIEPRQMYSSPDDGVKQSEIEFTYFDKGEVSRVAGSLGSACEERFGDKYGRSYHLSGGCNSRCKG